MLPVLRPGHRSVRAARPWTHVSIGLVGTTGPLLRAAEDLAATERVLSRNLESSDLARLTARGSRSRPVSAFCPLSRRPVTPMSSRKGYWIRAS
jgi:hypothetical protein